MTHSGIDLYVNGRKYMTAISELELTRVLSEFAVCRISYINRLNETTVYITIEETADWLSELVAPDGDEWWKQLEQIDPEPEKPRPPECKHKWIDVGVIRQKFMCEYCGVRQEDLGKGKV